MKLLKIIDTIVLKQTTNTDMFSYNLQAIIRMAIKHFRIHSVFFVIINYNYGTLLETTK